MNKDADITHWVNDYGQELFRWALFKTNDRFLAQDLVQDTFISAIEKKNEFKGNSSPKTWLFRILNNKIIDFYRSKSKNKHFAFSIDEVSALKLIDADFNDSGSWKDTRSFSTWSDDKHLLDDEDFNSIMKSCMDSLPELWFSVITSKYYDEKSAAEICQELDISPSNYWQLMHRSKLLLKKCIDSKWKS
jgi:RNA polymerase sigma-70 factor (ECF subfamily)